MLGLTLLKIFINYLKGYYNAVKCHSFQAVKGKPEGIKKTKPNHRRPTSQAVTTQEKDGEVQSREV